MNDISELYRELRAAHYRDFNKCFYCGCDATERDLVPPLVFASFFLSTREEADFLSVPSCKECYDLLRHEQLSTLQSRFDKLKRLLQRRYKKALRIYQVWESSEASELDRSLRGSINAGISLGEESYQRVAFKGFEYEVDGVKDFLNYAIVQRFEVFGESFTHFRDALAHASAAFSIPKAKLIDLYAEHGNSFDNAIQFFHQEIELKLYQKELKERCTIFAKEHKQNVKFVINVVEKYMKADEDLTIPLAIEKLRLERFSRSVTNKRQ